MATARQLLDPKAFLHSPSKSVDRKTTIPTSRETGAASILERQYGLSERDGRPFKKQKIDSAVKEKTFGHVGKGGELGDYVKAKRKEGVQDHVVDLTADEEVTFLGSSEKDGHEVCYGRIDRPRVNAHLVPVPGPSSVLGGGTLWPSLKVTLKRVAGPDNVIRVLDPTGTDFGTVDVRTALRLSRIMDNATYAVRTQARLSARKRVPGQKPGDECTESYDMNINLYGPKNRAQTIGRWLSQGQVFLRDPINHDAQIEICNPHNKDRILPPASRPGDPRPGRTTGYVTRTVEEIRSDVTGVFDSLKKSEDLPETDPDPDILTPLLKHQKQGLTFLQSKEDPPAIDDENSLWRIHFTANGHRSYYNVITGNEELTKPEQVRGGILADMMGLGKTLSILSLVVGSRDAAATWSKSDNTKEIYRSKSTLLIAPLSTLNNWEEQIGSHVRSGALSICVYHGASRTTDVAKLASYDMVITTYAIVASEWQSKKASPLLGTDFFRIVLDEAHQIREQATRQSQAICALSAQRRWAVTGTPVQNRLDDLGALIKFLRIRPFSDKGGFAQFILTPFKMADPEILPKLRLLVDTFTLRRLKDHIDLPPRHDLIVRLTFSPAEQKLYDAIAKDSQNRLSVMTGAGVMAGKSYVHVLRAIMRLRLICAHGRELLSEDDLRLVHGQSHETAIDLEVEAGMAPQQAYEMLMLARESNTHKCDACGKVVEPDEEEVFGCMLPCYQLLCSHCMEDVKASITKSAIDGSFSCPFCSSHQSLTFFDLTQAGLESAEADLDRRKSKTRARYGGPHTKVNFLLEKLQESERESKTLEAPIKSVVFSGWTQNLDLVQIALEERGIRYTRLDGRMSRKARNEAMEQFKGKADARVMLISIYAGGLGLNLTCASRVFVMEPQFNPAAEAQAVDRVHRLGQRREVVIQRLVMADSFELKMLDLQRKKQSLADLSMDRKKLDRTDAAKLKLEELRSLFR